MPPLTYNSNDTEFGGTALHVCGIPMKPGSNKVCMLHPHHNGLHKYYHVLKKAGNRLHVLINEKRIRFGYIQNVRAPYIYEKEFDTPYQLSLFEDHNKVIRFIAFVINVDWRNIRNATNYTYSSGTSSTVQYQYVTNYYANNLHQLYR